MKYKYIGENEAFIPQLGILVKKDETFNSNIKLNNSLLQEVTELKENIEEEIKEEETKINELKAEENN